MYSEELICHFFLQHLSEKTHLWSIQFPECMCRDWEGWCRKVYINSYKLIIICIPQAATHSSELHWILYISLINTDTCMYMYTHTNTYTYFKMQSLSSDWPCTNLSFQTVLNHSLKCGKLFLMNCTDHHMERKFCHTSLLMPVNRVLRKN